MVNVLHSSCAITFGLIEILKYKHWNCHAKHLSWEIARNEVYHLLNIEDTRSIWSISRRSAKFKNVMYCPCYVSCLQNYSNIFVNYVHEVFSNGKGGYKLFLILRSFLIVNVNLLFKYFFTLTSYLEQKTNSKRALLIRGSTFFIGFRPSREPQISIQVPNVPL